MVVFVLKKFRNSSASSVAEETMIRSSGRFRRTLERKENRESEMREPRGNPFKARCRRLGQSQENPLCQKQGRSQPTKRSLRGEEGRKSKEE